MRRLTAVRHRGRRGAEPARDVVEPPRPPGDAADVLVFTIWRFEFQNFASFSAKCWATLREHPRCRRSRGSWRRRAARAARPGRPPAAGERRGRRRRDGRRKGEELPTACPDPRLRGDHAKRRRRGQGRPAAAGKRLSRWCFRSTVAAGARSAGAPASASGSRRRAADRPGDAAAVYAARGGVAVRPRRVGLRRRRGGGGRGVGRPSRRRLRRDRERVVVLLHVVGAGSAGCHCRRCGGAASLAPSVPSRGVELQHRLADAALAARIVAGEVEMEMVVVEGVGARAEHGREVVAGADEDLAQELLLLLGAAPALHDRDLAAVGEAEGHHVERIAEGVLRQPRAAPAVARAAGIGAGSHLDDRGAEIERGRRLHHLGEPGVDRRDDRAGERRLGTRARRCRRRRPRP